MCFKTWLIALAQDAARRGCLGRFRRTSDLACWQQVWATGTAPTIAAVLAWATECPARFESLRITEPGLIERVLQNESDREDWEMAA